MEDVRVFDMYGVVVRIGWSEDQLREYLVQALPSYFFDSTDKILKYMPWHYPSKGIAKAVISRIKPGKIQPAIIVAVNVIHSLENIGGEITDAIVTKELKKYGAHPDYFYVE